MWYEVKEVLKTHLNYEWISDPVTYFSIAESYGSVLVPVWSVYFDLYTLKRKYYALSVQYTPKM